VSWRRWALQQLGGLVAVVIGLVVASLLLDDVWRLSTWLVFLAAWVVVTGVQAAVRARRDSVADR
jgi:hypothetical protein